MEKVAVRRHSTHKSYVVLLTPTVPASLCRIRSESKLPILQEALNMGTFLTTGSIFQWKSVSGSQRTIVPQPLSSKRRCMLDMEGTIIGTIFEISVAAPPPAAAPGDDDSSRTYDVQFWELVMAAKRRLEGQTVYLPLSLMMRLASLVCVRSQGGERNTVHSCLLLRLHIRNQLHIAR
mmetsp:Transcript_43720/g.72618  ORF Transcript_43720/g.72618 Transcript_43720/m.72618 type:complete len:178 (-) Transcript_43720:35-568(-)